MFERFTDRARRVVVLAQEEARDYPDTAVRPVHFLLGMIREGEGVAFQVLDGLGVTRGVVLDWPRVIQPVTEAATPHPATIPFTPDAKRLCELALREALTLGHNYLGTEHLLLGLVRQEGEGMQVLAKLGHDTQAVRDAVMAKLRGYESGGPVPRPVATLKYRREPSVSEVLATARLVADRLGDLDAYIETRAREIAAEALSRAESAKAELARIRGGDGA